MKGFALVLLCAFMVAVQSAPAINDSNGASNVTTYSYVQPIPIIIPMLSVHAAAPKFTYEEDSDDEVADSSNASSVPSSAYSSNFFRGFEDNMLKMEEKMNNMMNIFQDPGFFQNKSHFLRPIAPLQNKTSSITNFVDGNVVTVNRTSFSSDANNGSTRYQYQSIFVRPHEEKPVIVAQETNDGKTEEYPTAGQLHTIPLQILPMEEVPFDEWDSSETLTYPEPYLNEIDAERTNEIDDYSPVEVFHQYPERVVDLSGDVLVNKLVSDRAKGQHLFMIDPDAELLDMDVQQESRNQKMTTDSLQYEPIVEQQRI